jgi:pilus assembly protein CpaB
VLEGPAFRERDSLVLFGAEVTVSLRTVLLVLLAMACGLCAVVIARATLLAQRTGASNLETTPVVVASVDIPRGIQLSAKCLQLRDYPKDFVPAGALRTIEEAIDRAALGMFLKDEPVLEAKLAAKGAGRGMAALIPKGKRTITIQTSNVASAGSGFILPGNKVDVLMVPSGQSITNPQANRTTVLQHVEVWAVGPRMEAPVDNKIDSKDLREVTLLVTPEEAAILAEAQSKGVFHLALRNNEDREYTSISWSQRFGEVKGILESTAKLLAERKPKESFKPLSMGDSEPVFIRTIRGTLEGAVPVYAAPRDTVSGGR